MALEELEINLGYTFLNRQLLEQALTHGSTRNEQNLEYDNQRLEYLGDAALGLAAAEHLFSCYPDLPEGNLTIMRSSITNTSALARLARELDVGSHMRLGKGEEGSQGRTKENNLADTFEAIIGALYLDGGYPAIRALFEKLFIPLLTHPNTTNTANNPKGVVQEWAQQHKLPCPVYILLHEEGPPHQKIFTVQLKINDHMEAVGTGPSKRAAETEAAKSILAKLPEIR